MVRRQPWCWRYSSSRSLAVRHGVDLVDRADRGRVDAGLAEGVAHGGQLAGGLSGGRRRGDERPERATRGRGPSPRGAPSGRRAGPCRRRGAGSAGPCSRQAVVHAPRGGRRGRRRRGRPGRRRRRRGWRRSGPASTPSSQRASSARQRLVSKDSLARRSCAPQGGVQAGGEPEQRLRRRRQVAAAADLRDEPPVELAVHPPHLHRLDRRAEQLHALADAGGQAPLVEIPLDRGRAPGRSATGRAPRCRVPASPRWRRVMAVNRTGSRGSAAGG